MRKNRFYFLIILEAEKSKLKAVVRRGLLSVSSMVEDGRARMEWAVKRGEGGRERRRGRGHDS